MCYRLLDFVLDQGRVFVHEPGNNGPGRVLIETFKKLESAPARVTCGILTFLAISAWTQAFNAELPKVSYIKAIDVWTVSCNIFVFLSLMEYAFAQGPVLTRTNSISRIPIEKNQETISWPSIYSIG